VRKGLCGNGERVATDFSCGALGAVIFSSSEKIRSPDHVIVRCRETGYFPFIYMSEMCYIQLLVLVDVA
jgi:hypothetical protein